VDLLISTPGQPFSETSRHLPQRGTSFGESLRLALEDAFSRGYENVVVIGNDAPEISRSYLETAFERLESTGSQAAVLGPAHDGGYALLGLNRPCPQAFESMPWGSEHVARLTEARLSHAGFRVDRLDALEDIDSGPALKRFLARARRGTLAKLAKELANMLAQSSPHDKRRSGSLQEILFVGWRALRAPPYTCPN
jgi:glycosyltransferase A (GT-A) superfamily protein (DUF2064 family)